MPIMALRRYLRTWEEPYKFLTTLERALNITDANYRNLRRALADYKRLDSRTQNRAKDRLVQFLRSKLPNTDVTKKVREILQK